MNYYNVLEVSPNATSAEIKTAYKQLAMIHHPDRQGDPALFQGILTAFSTLYNAESRYAYDRQLMLDITEQLDNDVIVKNKIPFNSNRDLSIKLTVSLAQCYTGTEIATEYELLSGQMQSAIINIPAGTRHNQIIKYPGLGDNTQQDKCRGALNVCVIVNPDLDYYRVENDLYYVLNLSILEAVIGCTKTIKCLDSSEITIDIKPGLAYGTEYTFTNKGFKDITRRRGSFIVSTNVTIPAVTDPKLIKLLIKIYNKLTKTVDTCIRS